MDYLLLFLREVYGISLLNALNPWLGIETYTHAY
jgi:hypothetical protein